jgi:hypothetical protein
MAKTSGRRMSAEIDGDFVVFSSAPSLTSSTWSGGSWTSTAGAA